MKIGKEIALEAKKNGICTEWFKEMTLFNSYSRLVEMYFKGDDWSLEKDFPNIQLLRTHKGGIAPYGLITDVVDKTYLNVEKLAFFGDSKVKLEYSDFNIGENIILRHNTVAKVIASGNSIVFIKTLDNSKVDIECSESAKVTVFDYGKNTQIVKSGNVIVKQLSL